MKSEVPLNTLQRWMQSVIEHPGSNEEAWKSEQAERELPFEDAYAGVKPSKSLSPMDRIGIYRRMFFLRMTESMAIDYPGVKHFFGEEEFDRLVAEEYVHRFPSKSYTLNHLGRFFPQFFKESKLAEKEFLTDLARLELSITNNLEAEEKPILTQQQIAAVPQEQWEKVRLIPIAALELLECNYNVCSYLTAVNEESPIPAVKKERSFVVVYRNNYRTYWEELSEHQFVLLSSLTSGTLFGESIALLADRFPSDERELQTNLFEWFNEWVSNGYFSSIEHTT
ncbi:MAG: DNA-binding domain-containing protein [Bacteroidota bacterium]